MQKQCTNTQNEQKTRAQWLGVSGLAGVQSESRRWRTLGAGGLHCSLPSLSPQANTSSSRVDPLVTPEGNHQGCVLEQEHGTTPFRSPAGSRLQLWLVVSKDYSSACELPFLPGMISPLPCPLGSFEVIHYSHFYLFLLWEGRKLILVLKILLLLLFLLSSELDLCT